MSEVLILKLILVPALMAGITLAGRRWGPAVAGWLSAFPVVSAPILFFMALEQGPAFAAKAAASTLSAVLAILCFGLAYAWAATRQAWPMCLAVGFAAYAAAVAGLSLWAPHMAWSAPVVLVALLVVPRLYPPPPSHAMPQSTSAKPASDIWLRMLAGAVLVLLVTQFAARMGPGLSGLLAMFPVMASVLVVFSHRQAGAGFAIRLLKGTVLGYYAFAAFCAVLSLALPTAGIGPAFAMALGAAVLIQAASRLALQRHAPSTPAQTAPSPQTTLSSSSAHLLPPRPQETGATP
jgi:hypothetical protein